jgi:hypothetical protein
MSTYDRDHYEQLTREGIGDRVRVVLLARYRDAGRLDLVQVATYAGAEERLDVVEAEVRAWAVARGIWGPAPVVVSSGRERCPRCWRCVDGPECVCGEELHACEETPLERLLRQSVATGANDAR